MKTLLRYIVAAYRFHKAQRTVLEVDQWNDEDAAWIAHVFASPSGRKLKIYLTNNVIQSAASAIHNTANLTYAAGHAAGIEEQTIFIENLFPPERSASVQPSEAANDDALFARLEASSA